MIQLHKSFDRKHPPAETRQNGQYQLTNGTNPAGPQQAGGINVEKSTVCVFRVSNRKSTTENQAWGMERHIRNMSDTPEIRHIVASNWSKPIPEMEELLREVKAGRWKEVHFWRVDRLGRSHYWDVNFWRACVDHGVLLWFLEDDLRSDREGDEERFYDASNVGQKERKSISRRTKLGLARRKAEAQARGEKGPCIGKKPGDLWGKTRKMIPAVLALLKGGLSIRAIAANQKTTQRLVSKIAHASIETLREWARDATLQPWR